MGMMFGGALILAARKPRRERHDGRAGDGNAARTRTEVEVDEEEEEEEAEWQRGSVRVC